MTRPIDTDPASDALMLDLLRALSPAERFQRLCELSQLGTDLMKAAILHQQPNLSAEELRWELLRRRYGERFVARWRKVLKQQALEGSALTDTSAA